MKMTKGQSLCGAVTVEVPEACVHDVSVCHGNMCRQWGGGPLLAVECKHDVTLRGGRTSPITARQNGPSVRSAESAAPILYYLLLETQTYELSAGIFPDDRKRLVNQIYIESKPDFYDFAQQTPMLTEQDILDQFNSNS